MFLFSHPFVCVPLSFLQPSPSVAKGRGGVLCVAALGFCWASSCSCLPILAAIGPGSINCGACPGLFCDPTGMVSREVIRRRSPGQLKRLGFVRTYSQYYWAKANQLMSTVYSNGRSYVPGYFDSSVRGLEHRISDATLPLITAVQTKSIGVLTSLDNQVASSFKTHVFFWAFQESRLRCFLMSWLVGFLCPFWWLMGIDALLVERFDFECVSCRSIMLFKQHTASYRQNLL